MRSTSQVCSASLIFIISVGILCHAECPTCQHGVCRTLINGSQACHCDAGWTDPACDKDVNECLSAPCKNNATCNNTNGSYNCICSPGFRGTDCSNDFDECTELRPCQNFISCSNLPGDYRCQCVPGWSGKNCSTNIDDCASSPCFHGRCEDLVAGYRCHCPPLMLGTRCEAVLRICSFSNPCPGEHSVCAEKLEGGHECLCRPGYRGQNCSIDIDECASSPCRNGASCVDRVNDFHCKCATGFSGRQCEVDEDDCASAPCLNNATCQNIPGKGGFQCHCLNGTTGKRCEVNFDDCASNPCHAPKLCEDKIGGFLCSCPTGRTGSNCSDWKTPCASSPCQHGATCYSSNVSFTCSCATGYSGDRCERDIDPCLPNPCLYNGRCIVTNRFSAAGFRCECPSGFIGPRCQGDLNECLSSPCLHGGICRQRAGVAGFDCTCPTNRTGNRCQLVKDECTGVVCSNGGICKTNGSTHLCQCRAGFHGTLCEADVDECVTQRPCLHGGQCLNLPGTFQCICPPLWNGSLCETPILQCDNNTCSGHGKCEQIPGRSFNCLCDQGFHGLRCEEKINNCSSSPCTRGTCISGINNFTCSCPEGYSGRLCEVVVDLCAASPCHHGGHCSHSAPGRITCTCPIGMYGDRCETVRAISLDGSSLLIIPDVEKSSRRRRRAVSEILLSWTMTMPTAQNAAVLAITTPQFAAVLVLRDFRLTIHAFHDGKISSAVGGSIANSSEPATGLQSGTFSLLLNSSNIYITYPCMEGKCALDLIIASSYNSFTNLSIAIGGIDKHSIILRALLPYDTGSHLSACVANVTLNGQLLNLTDQMSPSAVSCPVNLPTCLPNSCANGGQCVTRWRKIECRCLSGFSGPRCQFWTTAYFRGQQMLHLASNWSSVHQLRIRFAINVTSSRDKFVVLYSLRSSVASTPMIIFVSSGRVEIVIYHQAKLLTLKSHRNNFADGFYHNITVNITNNSLSSSISNTSLYAQDLHMDGPLYIGLLHHLADASVNPWIDLSVQPISGCVGPIGIDGRTMDFTRASKSPLGGDPHLPVAGCPADVSCSTSPCLHSGLCSPSFTTFRCLCMPGTDGLRCEKGSEVTLDGQKSYARFLVNTALIPLQKRMTFWFRTRLKTTRLLYAMFLMMSTKKFSVEARLNAGKMEIETEIAETASRKGFFSIAADGQWHEVILEFSSETRSLTASLDNASTITIPSNFSIYDTRNPEIVIYVGARPSIPDDVTSPMLGFFKGCFRSILLDNSNFLPLLPPSEGLNASSIKTGCHGDPVCRRTSCSANARCVDEWNVARCVCQAGWTSHPYCNISVNDCQDHSCLNGGSCLDGHRNLSCLCAMGFTGKRCEMQINRCANQSLCHPLGSLRCVPVFPANYTCECRPGFTGRNCSQKIDQCLSDPCHNGGTCRTTMAGFNCQCPLGFQGITCASQNACLSSPCLHGGRCTSQLNSSAFNCSCKDPYEGLRCEARNPCFNNPCFNFATCLRQKATFLCQCPYEFHGYLCQYRNACVSSPCLHGSCVATGSAYNCSCFPGVAGTSCHPIALSSATVIVPVILVVALASSIIFFIIILRKRRRMKGIYMPYRNESDEGRKNQDC